MGTFSDNNKNMKTQKPFLIAVAVGCMFTAACAKKNVAVAPPAHQPAPAAASAANTAPTPRSTPPAATQSSASNAPASRYPDEATRNRIAALLAKIEDAYFNYNEATLRADAVKALQSDSTELRDILKNIRTTN